MEGFAYDKDNKIIANAEVSIILKTDKSIYYKTTTDSRGFFTIYSKDLPFLDYYLEFIDTATKKKTIQTTFQFMKNNESYVQSEGLDMMKSTKNNQPIINPNTGQLNEIRNEKGNLTPTMTAKQTVNYRLLSVMLIIILLILISIGMVFYLRKSR